MESSRPLPGADDCTVAIQVDARGNGVRAPDSRSVSDAAELAAESQSQANISPNHHSAQTEPISSKSTGAQPAAEDATTIAEERTLKVDASQSDVTLDSSTQEARAASFAETMADARRARTSARGASGVDRRGATIRDAGAAPAMLDGATVPGYDLLEELGRGGMGVVYKARDRRLNRLVALKMILGGAHVGQVGLARFRAEAEAVAELHHANIVQIFETGEHDGCPYLALEFVDGGSLEDQVRASPMTPLAAAELVETLARAMDFAHQRGIVHRDLKPANILLASQSGHSSSGRRKAISSDTPPAQHWSRTTSPKIADFGLAKRLDDESGNTQSGSVMGTPCYMAPEQAEGHNRQVGPAADIYALGSIFYDLLVGRPPFKANNPIDTIRQVIGQEPVPPRQLEPRVPRDLETICLKCLEKDPARRFATALDLALDLRRFLDGHPIESRPIRTWERGWKWAKRRPAIVALIGVCALAAVGMVLVIAWHNVSLRGRLNAALAEERQLRARARRGRSTAAGTGRATGPEAL